MSKLEKYVLETEKSEILESFISKATMIEMYPPQTIYFIYDEILIDTAVDIDGNEHGGESTKYFISTSDNNFSKVVFYGPESSAKDIILEFSKEFPDETLKLSCQYRGDKTVVHIYEIQNGTINWINNDYIVFKDRTVDFQRYINPIYLETIKSRFDHIHRHLHFDGLADDTEYLVSILLKHWKFEFSIIMNEKETVNLYYLNKDRKYELCCGLRPDSLQPDDDWRNPTCLIYGKSSE